MAFLDEKTQAVSQAERRWVWIFAALVMTITLLPYLIGFSRQGSDWRFTGFLFGVTDGNSYIAKMLIGTAGNWLFRTPYTAYPQQRMILFIPYMLLGKLAAPPGLHAQLTALFHIFRLAAGLMAVHATYDFLALFLAEGRWRRLGTALAVLGGGFGWLTVAGLQHLFAWGLPLEAYSPEAFGFLSIYGLPHMAAARALLLWGLRDFLLLAGPLSRFSGWLRASALWVGVWIFQPLVLIVGVFVIALFIALTAVWQYIRGRRQEQVDWGTWKQYLGYGLRIGIISLPFAGYTFLSIRLDPLLQAWETQNIIASPPPLDYLFGYGVALPLALLSFRPLAREDPWRAVFLGGWLLAAPFLAYAPIGIQRRLIEGVWMVITVLAILGVARIPPRLQKFAYGWLSLAFLTTTFLLTSGFLFAMNPGKPLFRPADEVKAFEFLASAARPGEVVLAADDSANPLPAWAPVRTLVGHGPESINGNEIRERVACFYSDACTDAYRAALLAEFGVKYVLWGPGERDLGAWDPNTFSMLEPVYAAGDYQVFRVQLPGEP